MFQSAVVPRLCNAANCASDYPEKPLVAAVWADSIMFTSTPDLCCVYPLNCFISNKITERPSRCLEPLNEGAPSDACVCVCVAEHAGVPQGHAGVRCHSSRLDNLSVSRGRQVRSPLSSFPSRTLSTLFLQEKGEVGGKRFYPGGLRC